MKTYLKKIFLGTLALFLAFYVYVSFGTSPALATSTFVWNSHGSYVPMYCAHTSSYNEVKLWIPNGTGAAGQTGKGIGGITQPIDGSGDRNTHEEPGVLLTSITKHPCLSVKLVLRI